MSELKVSANTKTVAELLKPGCYFRIPPYQRSYSWLNQDALALLNDLQDAVSQERNHFLGAIVSIETGTPGILEIVDGQQRLTTLTLLLCSLRNHEPDADRIARLEAVLQDPENSGSWRLTPNHVDAPYFRQLLRPRSIVAREVAEPTTDSHELLRSNMGALDQEIAATDMETRRQLQDLILDKCPIIQVSVRDRDEGYKVFQVLNARGRQPNGHDILKTELFERAKLSGEEADRLARAWSNHEARLGARDFDDLLRQIRLLFDPNTKGDLVTGFCQSVLGQISPRDFLAIELPKYVGAYAELKTGQVNFSRPMPDVNAFISRLHALDHSGWRAPALQFLVKHSRDADTAREFFGDLERLGYAMQLLVTDRDARPRRYRRVCEDIGSDKTLFARNGALSLTREERAKLALRLTGRFGSVSQRRALCLKVSSLMSVEEDLTLAADATVEHVLPRSVGEGSVWLESWPDLAERRELADTLGNLCLLTKKDNQRADRLGFAEKRQRFFEDPNIGGQFALTREITNYTQWTPAIVRKRTQKLVDLLISDWKLDRNVG